jgi:hypothetical protein
MLDVLRCLLGSIFFYQYFSVVSVASMDSIHKALDIHVKI